MSHPSTGLFLFWCGKGSESRLSIKSFLAVTSPNTFTISFWVTSTLWAYTSFELSFYRCSPLGVVLN